MAVKLKLLGSIQQIITSFHDICWSTMFFSWRFKKDFFPERDFSTFGLKKKHLHIYETGLLRFLRKLKFKVNFIYLPKIIVHENWNTYWGAMYWWIYFFS